MRAHIIITDEKGVSFEGEVELTRASRGRATDRGKVATATASPQIGFDMPIRAFVKKYARGMSRPRKFVLLLSYLAKGQTGKEVLLRDVERHWNKMTSATLMGGRFNRSLTDSAKGNGWVDTKKPGVYVLQTSWKQIFS